MSVFNNEQYIRQAVDSIINQTFTNFEFLIIDDASSDNMPKILRDYNDPRIRIITNEENLGLTKSLNKGIAASLGEYIARQDADDVSLPKRLESQIAFLENNPNVAADESSRPPLHVLAASPQAGAMRRSKCEPIAKRPKTVPDFLET